MPLVGRRLLCLATALAESLSSILPSKLLSRRGEQMSRGELGVESPALELPVAEFYAETLAEGSNKN